MTEADWRMKALTDFFGAKFVEEERIKQDMEAMGKANDATPREALVDASDPRQNVIDLKEIVAKAIHDSHGSDFYGTWDEAVATEVVIDDMHPNYQDSYVGRIRDEAAAAIQAFATALLSEPVVAAAAAATATESDYYEFDGPFIGLMVHARTTDEANDIFVRAALNAALVAMGGGENASI